MKPLLIEKKNHVTWVTLNRPDVHNAFNEDLIQELFEVFRFIDHDTGTRLAVLTAVGKSFSAGADLNHMKSAATKTREQNTADSLFMAKMLSAINNTSKPVLGVINGTALGGGLGLVSVCDVVVAHESATFGFSEVKLGMAPSVISPFAIAKIGFPNARRFFLTGERFDVVQAKSIGLVHEIYNDANHDEVVTRYIKMFSQNSANAMAEAKRLIRMNQELVGEALSLFTAEQISDLRASPDAQEGMKAFFEKRKPSFDISSHE